MNGYKMIAIALLFIVIASIYDLGPSIKQVASRIADLPQINLSQAREPVVLTVAMRAMYLIALVGIIKLLVSRKKDE